MPWIYNNNSLEEKEQDAITMVFFYFIDADNAMNLLKAIEKL